LRPLLISHRGAFAACVSVDSSLTMDNMVGLTNQKCSKDDDHGNNSLNSYRDDPSREIIRYCNERLTEVIGLPFRP
jgi:hypothetical protein